MRLTSKSIKYIKKIAFHNVGKSDLISLMPFVNRGGGWGCWAADCPEEEGDSAFRLLWGSVQHQVASGHQPPQSQEPFP